MKLARPDLRHPRIVLAGNTNPDGDDDGLVGALRVRGLHARWHRWDDPETLRADLVILQAGIEYRGRLDKFLAWTKQVPKLLNAPEAVAWNTGRHYLRDLADAGVRTGPPNRGEAETALIFLGGTQSHALRAESALEADFELWDAGYAALDAAAERLGIRPTELLCARAQVAGGPGEARLTSLDLVAPLMGWRMLDHTARADAERRFALAVESALQRLGLGPFSHRRP